MENTALIVESIKFMVLGMFVVFAFLTVLIVVVNVQAKIIAKFFPEKPSLSSSTQTDDKHHVAAIVAAVTEFRKNQ